MFSNRFFRNILKCSKLFSNISRNYPGHCELFSNIFHYTLKCLKTCSGTFWMFRNILKSSNGTFWNVCKQILQEHFKKFKTIFWTFLAIVSCSHTFFNSHSNGTFWNVSKQILQEQFKMFKLFSNISSNYPEQCELFSNIFTTFWNVYKLVRELFECLGTFWKVLMEHSEVFPNQFFKNILKSSKLFSIISSYYPKHCELLSNIFHLTLWNVHKLVWELFECSEHFKKFCLGTL